MSQTTPPTPVRAMPAVLALLRLHTLTDAEFHNVVNGVWQDTPVEVIRHGIRGLQNLNDGGDNIAPDTTANDADRHVSNLQMTESAKLMPEAAALRISYAFAMLPLDSGLAACAGKEADLFRANLRYFLDRVKGSDGLREVAARYARNIANGRWVWRNRSIARDMAVDVRCGDTVLTFDSFAISLGNFDAYSADELKLADIIAGQLAGNGASEIKVAATLTPLVHGSVEVFPSQCFTGEKVKGFSRPLYKLGHPEPLAKMDVGAFRVMGRAAFRDQKVWNAIRTIDTWYPDYEDVGVPIPVEPLGANLAMQRFFRERRHTAFDMFRRLGEIDPNSPEGMFCIACLDRGGVYGASEKNKKNETTPTEQAKD